MTLRHARPRAGFTLIEVLIVMGIIATLAAISVGVFFQVSGSQEKSVTEVTLNKLHSTFDGKYKAVLDDAKKEVKNMSATDPFMVACGGSRDRANVVMTLIRLRVEFPETKGEASGTDTLLLPSGQVVKPRAVFSTLAAKLPADPTGNTEADYAKRAMISSALAYAALTQTGIAGTMGATEGLQQQTRTDPAGFAYFVDSWGQPIGFYRHATNAEINKPPYSQPRTVPGIPNPVLNGLDPNGTMLAGSPGYTPGSLNPTLQSFGQAQLPSVTAFSNMNSLSTFYSAGPNKEFGPNPLDMNPAQGDECLDNLFSYRLRREGARGD